MAGNDFPSIAKAKRRYKHGTHARYVLARCRCEPCRVSNREYEKDRQARRRPPYHLKYSPSGKLWVVRNGKSGKIAARTRTKAAAQRKADKLNAEHTTSSELVSTAEVLDHIRWLQSQGVGIKTLSKASTVSGSVINRMIDGDIKRTRRSTMAKILSVGADVVKHGARMRADDTMALVASLVDAGYTRGWIAQKLGAQSAGLQVGRAGWISIGKARAIHNIYLWVAKRDPSVRPISATFKIGEAESSMARGRGALRAKPTTKITLPPHGTAARARHGCRCNGCIGAANRAGAAKTRFGQLRYIARFIGGRWVVRDTISATIAFRTNDKGGAFAVARDLNSKDPCSSLTMLVDATPVRKHLRQIYAQGTTIAAMARASGVSNAQVHFLMSGRSRRTSGRKASALLALSSTALPTAARIDAAPTYLLVDRLEAAGFATQWLASVLDLPVRHLRNRSKRVSLERARDIAALYSVLRERVSTVKELERAA